MGVEITRVGESSTLRRAIIALMREAEDAKPPVTRLLDRYAGQYMALVLLVAAGTLVPDRECTGHASGAGGVLSMRLVLAAPATSVAAIVVAARRRHPDQGAAFLERLADVSAVVFDKTGTITTGELHVLEVVRSMASTPAMVSRSLPAASAPGAITR